MNTHFHHRVGRRFLTILLLAILLLPERAAAVDPEGAFLADAFPEGVPTPRALWLTGAVALEYRAITGQEPPQLRLRYWAGGGRSVWILEAIGKELPITAGFVVEEGHLVRTRVLHFRESRGFEVRYPFFTDQFQGAALRGERLDRPIDGISGATLSVRAMERMARLALALAGLVAAS